MANRVPESPSHGRLITWLLQGASTRDVDGPHRKQPTRGGHNWFQVMCLTGVDYFSTLGYQPGIAALAAGVLSPIATLILVLVTLFGALPIYLYVAKESPHGEGSIAMLEHLLTWWKGKLFVLVLLGFVATDFTVTITLSAADATAHILENPFAPAFLQGHPVIVTLLLIAFLSAVFLKGFKDAIGIAVGLVGAYLAMNAILVARGLWEVATHATLVADWQQNLWSSQGDPLTMIAIAMLVFPKLALGLSGFETGVAVMPLVQGDADDTEAQPTGRVRNTRRLLTTAAVTMCAFLLATSVITTLLIPPGEFQPGGKANGRALAYLAHQLLGDAFGTGYDLVTILILWFAGASAMAGLINIVPRYLPRYGMAPEWTRAARPLVLVYTVAAFLITWFFQASVDAQAGAYATGVLVLMSAAAVAVTLSCHRRGERKSAIAFGVITLVFLYTLGDNVVERPDGLKIASVFIGALVILSLVSRIWRTLELRVSHIELDATAQQFLRELGDQPIHVLAHNPRKRTAEAYAFMEKDQRDDFAIPADEPVLFLEVTVRDASDFSDVLRVSGAEIHGYRVFRAQATAVPNGIAAFLLHLRDTTKKRPNAYFNWGESNPILYLIQYILSGHGDVAPVTREVLRKAEPIAHLRPAIYVGI